MMNLSKSGKLLAAKKKLKEFQLNKMLQVNSPKPPEDLLETLPSLQETIKTMNTTRGHSLEELNSYTMETTNETVDEKELLECMEEAITKDELDRQDKINYLQDIPMVQKDYLLEMTSAVKDVLTNNAENQVGSSLDTDLAYRNHFLNTRIEEQKRSLHEVYLEISNHRSRVLELEQALAGRDEEYKGLLEREIKPLREQLHVHAQTTGILIAEKAELTAALSQAQHSARQCSEGTEELTEKLRQFQQRQTELEREIVGLKQNNEETKRNSQRLRTDYETLETKFLNSRKEKEDQSLEISELRQKYNLKKTELVSAQQELQEKTALLSLSELRIQQMKDTTQSEDERHASLMLEQELARTREALKTLHDEKDDAGKQYQNYVRQLDAQQAKLIAEAGQQKKMLQDFETRERSYIGRLSELEQQLQGERARAASLSTIQNHKDDTENLLKSVDELTLEHDRLLTTLVDKDTQIESLTKEVKKLQNNKDQTVEISKLASALESEQLGASRAIAQNQRMKLQLTDMENAFVSLSNAKLDLTEQLQAERSIGRKLNTQLNTVESQMDELKKLSLQNAQIADQMQHYQVQASHAHTYQQELQNALVSIDRLENEKLQLIDKLKEKDEKSNDSLDPINESEIDLFEGNEGNQQNEDHAIEIEDSFCEPVRKLEERFKETMEKVADLTEEKQKLEHLVLQLQSETETIGEYITLYQKQRAVLQGRAREKDQAFRQLLDQRNQQQEQLHKLKLLVSEYLQKHLISGETPWDPRKAKEVQDLGAVMQPETNGQDSTEHVVTAESGVSELLDLLTEIKDCKDSSISEPNFHPCPWCSGKLLTV